MNPSPYRHKGGRSHPMTHVESRPMTEPPYCFNGDLISDETRSDCLDLSNLSWFNKGPIELTWVLCEILI